MISEELALAVLLTKSSLDYIDNSLAGIDVGDNLTFSVGVFGSILKNNDLWALKLKKVRNNLRILRKKKSKR